jgi:curved DNA-binding protein CbpA
MKTLYDFLGALPDDDAESLRTAFRKAAKATHPDINTGDPDASLKFRQIVRANAILGDAEQRAAYDRLLAITLEQRRPKSKRTIIFDTIHTLAFDAFAAAFFSTVLFGGHALFEHLSMAPVIPVERIELAARGPAEIAAVPATGQFDTAVLAVPDQATVPSADAAVVNTSSTQAMADLGPAPDPAANDAKSYRERGAVAYRDGDLHGAIADFELAIQIDPRFTGAYIDRGIVFYRLHEFDRAFADIAQAKRIEHANRTKTALSAPHQATPSSGKN